MGSRAGEQGLPNNKTPLNSGQGFQNEKTTPVATTDTYFQECCCGPYGKQYLPARKLTLPSPDAHENPPRVPPRTAPGTKKHKKMTPEASKLSKNDPWGCSLQPPFHTSAGTAPEVIMEQAAASKLLVRLFLGLRPQTGPAECAERLNKQYSNTE